MPADSAIWRYRWYNIDYITTVLDNIIYLNGTDTVAYGNTYHKLISRAFMQTVPNGTIPPVISETANISDQYYGAIRESGKKVYLLSLSGEDLLFDFNAVIGDSIPAYVGKIAVTGTDSLNIGGIFHKIYFTTDSTYYVIEGVGSNRGLIPQLNDGGPQVQFLCFTDGLVTWSPDTALPCTSIYQEGHESVAGISNASSDIIIFPNPVADWIHVKLSEDYKDAQFDLFDMLGRKLKVSLTNNNVEFNIFTGNFDPGIYFLKITSKDNLFSYKVIKMYMY
jgi:hypothetical protein